LEPPIIKVQCKSTEGKLGAPDVQARLGTLGNRELGFFVTLGADAVVTHESLDECGRAQRAVPVKYSENRAVQLVVGHWSCSRAVPRSFDLIFACG
jgi:hypothetical protein